MTKEEGPGRQEGSVRWGLVVFLIVGLLIVDAAVLKIVYAGQLQLPEPGALMLAGLILSQVAMLSLWAVLGGTPAPVRLFGLVLGVVLWASLSSHHDRPPARDANLSGSILFLLGQALFICVPLLMLRRAGLRIVSLPLRAPTQPGPALRQFSLGYLMAWVTCVAVVLGLLRYCVVRDVLSRNPEFWLDISLWGAGQAAIALAGFYAALGQARWYWRWIPLVVGCLVLAFLAVWHRTSFIVPKSPRMLLAQAALLVVSLYVIRGAGLRLGRGK